MENSVTKEQENNEILINSEIKAYLLETSKWSKFLAIVGYIGLGLLVLLSLFIMLGLSKINRAFGSGFPITLLGLIYILVAVLYYFPVNYLYKFSVKIKQGLESNEIDLITSGFQNLKSLSKFMGIFTIVILSLYGLMFFIGIIAALMVR